MLSHIRRSVDADAAICGRIMHRAFRGIAEIHGFTPDIATDEAGIGLASVLIGSPTAYGVVAETDEQVVGSNFLLEGDPIWGLGPITVDPPHQGRRIGRRLMEAVLEHAREAEGVRLAGDAFNTRSIPLYASLGFAVKEPLLLMRGRCRSEPLPGTAVRPLASTDLDDCAQLCAAIHGVPRTTELRNALAAFKPFVVERNGRVVGYLSAANAWVMNHGVAETESDMTSLLAGASAASGEISFLLPVRQHDLFQWCVAQGLQAQKPMLLMALGTYHEPKGAWFPSVFY